MGRIIASNTVSKWHDVVAVIEAGLERLLPRATGNLDRALRYAVFPGGKRMRPMLTLLGADIVSSDITCAIPAACAIEFLHTASLIFDDLPSMDNTDVRRGRLALHIEFGEGTAILAALALFNQAYAVFGRTPALIQEATECVGVDGMIGGQAVDLGEAIETRNRKTSALMRLALTAGAIACGASPKDVEALGRCGACLGEAYQVYDDLQDQDARPNQRADGVTVLIAEANEILVTCFGNTKPVIALTRAINSTCGLICV